jgi:DNA repair exonuclease SbcCD ATPase subunit
MTDDKKYDECQREINNSRIAWQDWQRTAEFERKRAEAAEAEIKHLQEINSSLLKDIQNPSPETWNGMYLLVAKRAEAAKDEIDKLRSENVRLCSVCNQHDDDYQKVMTDWSEYIKEQNAKYQAAEAERDLFKQAIHDNTIRLKQYHEEVFQEQLELLRNAEAEIKHLQEELVNSRKVFLTIIDELDTEHDAEAYLCGYVFADLVRERVRKL